MKKPLFEKKFRYSGDSFEDMIGEASPLDDAIGKVSMGFGVLEDTLSSSIVFLLGAESDKGLIVTSEMSFSSKLNTMASLVRREYGDHPLEIEEDDFNDLIYMCTKSEELRNKILHSSWVYDHSKTIIEVRRRKLSAKRRSGFRHEEEPLNSGQIVDISDYIVYTAVSVDEFFTGCFGNYVRSLNWSVG